MDDYCQHSTISTPYVLNRKAERNIGTPPVIYMPLLGIINNGYNLGIRITDDLLLVEKCMVFFERNLFGKVRVVHYGVPLKFLQVSVNDCMNCSCTSTNYSI